jgi:hypothetical protein
MVWGRNMARHSTCAVPQGTGTVINSSAVLSFAGSVLRAVALAVFALYFAQAIPPTLLRCVRWTRQAIAMAGEDSLAERRRFLTPPYVARIETIRRAIPRDGEYLLVDGGTELEGGAYWVRFELAPRRARYLGRLSELPAASILRRTMPQGPRWLVISFRDPVPPILLERETFLVHYQALTNGGS